MSSCGKISADALINCAQQLVGGVKDRLILINQDDIDTITYDIDNPLIVTDITLVSSPAARAYVFEGKNNSIDASWALNKGKYANNYDHTVVFKIFDDSPEVRQQIEALANGKFVAIQENNYRGANDEAAFEIKGLGVGLVLTVAKGDRSDADTQGAPDLTLATPDTYKEPKLPAFFFDTDYVTTRAAVNALIAGA